MHKLYGEMNMGSFKIGRSLVSSTFKKPSTRRYPEVKREWQENTKGHIEIDAGSCILCGICAKKCPADALTVDKQARKWTIDRMSCVQCRSCVESCPKSCLFMRNDYIQPSATKVIDTVDIPEKEKTKKDEGPASQ